MWSSSPPPYYSLYDLSYLGKKKKILKTGSHDTGVPELAEALENQIMVVFSQSAGEMDLLHGVSSIKTLSPLG